MSLLTGFPFLYLSLTRVIDGTDGFSILPLAALLTGALFTIGIAVLLVVVLAIRRKRDGHGTGLCDGKEKHMGKDEEHRWKFVRGVELQTLHN